MNKENIKKLYKTLKESDYKEVVASVILFEKLDYIHDIEDITDGDIETLEDIYNKYMHSPTISGLLNEEINDIIEEIKGDEEND